MMTNPFDWTSLPRKQAETFQAEIISNSPFGVPLQKLGEKTASKDTRGLCETQHLVETWVSLGVGDQDPSTIRTASEAKRYIVPGESNLIVAFYPQDTSGGGKVEQWFNDWIVTPLIKTGAVVLSPLGVIAITAGDFISNTAFWVTGGAVGGRVTREEWGQNVVDLIPTESAGGKTLTAIGCTITPWMKVCRDSDDKLDRGLWSVFSADTVGEATDSLFGTTLHPANADAHKVLVEISVERPNGVVVQKHRKFVAGLPEIYEQDGEVFQKPGLGVFAIDEPGEWTVRITPAAWGTCANVEWESVETFTVDTPEGWNPSETLLEPDEATETTQRVNQWLEDAGLPAGVTVAAVATAAIVGVSLVSFKLLSR